LDQSRAASETGRPFSLAARAVRTFGAGAALSGGKARNSGMSYYIATTLKVPFDEAIERTQAALKEQGFGIISRIDLQAAFKEKIGVDFRPYTILGACNPKLAHEALQLEDKVGTMLPCNVVVQAKGEGETEIAAIDPVASMQAIDNAALKEAAAEVRERLRAVVRDLEKKGVEA
jgi:uncharacterized protein (DUF302 family)